MRHGRAYEHDGRSPKHQPMRGVTGGGVGSWIERHARIQPERIAVAWGEERITPRPRRPHPETEPRAQLLRDRPGKSDRVAGTQPPGLPLYLFRASTLGAALAPVNHRLDQEAMAAQLADASPTVLVTNGVSPDQSVPRWVQALITVGPSPGTGGDFDDLVAGLAEDPIRDVASHDDVCLIPYTSGTTGASKGVMLTHGNVTWNVINLLTRADFRNGDITLGSPHFPHRGYRGERPARSVDGGNRGHPGGRRTRSRARPHGAAPRHGRVRQSRLGGSSDQLVSAVQRISPPCGSS